MADQKEPKKETVRIALPPRPPGAPTPPRPLGSETVRINMPARPPAGPVARPPAAQAPPPPALSKAAAAPPAFRPPSPASATAPARPAPPPPPAPSGQSGIASAAGPRKETARISLAPERPARPAATVQMKKTQPLVTMPVPSRQTSPIPVNIAPDIEHEDSFVESLPMSFCWAILAASVVILTIQIWNYLS